MPSFNVSSVGETYTYILVNTDTRYNWYRVYVRLDDGSNTTVYDQWHNLTTGEYIRIGGLSPGTDYAVNVAYNTTNAASGSTWIGLVTFRTNGTNPGGGGGTTTTYYAYLAYNANGGSGAPSQHLVSGTTETFYATISSVVPTRSGYTFAGWWLYNVESYGTYPAGGRVPITGTAGAPSSTPHTLYAQWIKGASTGSVHIGNGYGFDSYTPYIWYNGGWQKAVPYVWYNGGWKKGV